MSYECKYLALPLIWGVGGLRIIAYERERKA
jgi:hypothetical protein